MEARVRGRKTVVSTQNIIIKLRFSKTGKLLVSSKDQRNKLQKHQAHVEEVSKLSKSQGQLRGVQRSPIETNNTSVKIHYLSNKYSEPTFHNFKCEFLGTIYQKNTYTAQSSRRRNAQEILTKGVRFIQKLSLLYNFPL
ncbi:hypothetical protein Mapa_001211 [Marchantia paleacea]|nr:hypothetical protein Mapa_001211 [Marchantia paleacea]